MSKPIQVTLSFECDPTTFGTDDKDFDLDGLYEVADEYLFDATNHIDKEQQPKLTMTFSDVVCSSPEEVRDHLTQIRRGKKREREEEKEEQTTPADANGVKTHMAGNGQRIRIDSSPLKIQPFRYTTWENDDEAAKVMTGEEVRGWFLKNEMDIPKEFV